MAEKALCPSCNGYFSDIYRAFRDREPCPHCGLPAEVAAEVAAARERYRDDERTEKLAEAIAARGKAEAERDDYLHELDEVRRSVQGLLSQIEAACRPLAEKARERDGW